MAPGNKSRGVVAGPGEWLESLSYPKSQEELEKAARNLTGALKNSGAPDPALVEGIAKGLAKIHGPYVTNNYGYSPVEGLAATVAPFLSEEQADHILSNRLYLLGGKILADAPKISPITQAKIVQQVKSQKGLHGDQVRNYDGIIANLAQRKDLSPNVPDGLLEGQYQLQSRAAEALGDIPLSEDNARKVLAIAHRVGSPYIARGVLDNSPVSLEDAVAAYKEWPHHIASAMVERPDLPVSVRKDILNDPSTVMRMSQRHDLTDEEVQQITAAARDNFVADAYLIPDFLDRYHDRVSGSDIERMLFNGHNRLSSATTAKMARHLQPDHLKALIKNKSLPKDVRDVLKDELIWNNPDSAHKERINVAFGTNKLRILRDKIGEMGHDQATPKELPRELVQAVGNTGRLPNGNYSAKLLQQAIDAQPRTPFNVSHAVWRGQQKHSSEPSKVFQLNLTTEMAQKLKDAGVYDTYRRLWNRSNSGSHPIGLPGIGWVRWTGSAKDGIHIDELQSDFGQRLSRMIDDQAQQAREQGWSEADIQQEVDKLKKEFPEKDIDKINEIVFGGKHSSHVLMEAFHEWARSHKAEVKSYAEPKKKIWFGYKKTDAEKRYDSDVSNASEWYDSDEGKAWRAANPDKAKQLEELDAAVTNSRHPFHSEERQAAIANLALHWGEFTGQNHFDASMARYQNTPTKKGPKRYEGLVGAKVATWQPETKAPISGLRSDKPLPKHIVVGHRDVPEKMGFRPSIYGNLPTQKGSFDKSHGRAFYHAANRDPAKGLPEEHVFTDMADEDGSPIKVPKGAPTMEEEIRKSEGFLEAVLGAPAAQALIKTAERSPVMASAMLPRAVIAWLDFASRWPYNGTIPGCGNTYIEFTKSEAGFTGAIEADGQSYEFQDAPMLEIAAAVGVALGWDSIQPSDRLTKAQVESVGSQMDLLVKATFLAKAAKQGHDKPGAPAAPMQNTNPKQAGFDTPAPPQKGAKRNAFKSEPCEKCGKKECKCGKKSRTIKVSKAEALTECSVCGAAQWDSGDLTFCYCLRDLRKNASSNSTDDGYEVTFGPRWGDSDIQVFLDIVHGDSNG